MVHLYKIFEDKHGEYILYNGDKKRRLETYCKWLDADNVPYRFILLSGTPYIQVGWKKDTFSGLMIFYSKIAVETRERDMNYFDYLSFTGLKDTQENFEKYLVEVLDYTVEEAEKESKWYY